MLFSIVLLTAIILASSFGLHIMPIEPIYNMSSDMTAQALYVCPVASPFFDSFSAGIRPFIRQINMFFFFTVMLLVFGWGWSLYQNLLKDKFEQGAFKNPWFFTKAIFWMAVVILLLVWTPNSYRSVTVVGGEGTWVLCEENTPGALPVMAGSVKR